MDEREFLRHTVATLAYRAAKTVRGAPAAFADFLPGPESNTPRTIVAHMGDLFDWALTMVRDGVAKVELGHAAAVGRRVRALLALQAFDITSGAAVHFDARQAFRARSPTRSRTGQLAMLRRLHARP